ncbi:unnamed protein product [Linum tenue]|uniref:Uncharacterized protein n=1 Tax=Linum tenue TaxID=586396 RepID=A0AAV0GXB3_9ROSI|nr:unnamed protein product [Linum tenue]
MGKYPKLGRDQQIASMLASREIPGFPDLEELLAQIRITNRGLSVIFQAQSMTWRVVT